MAQSAAVATNNNATRNKGATRPRATTTPPEAVVRTHVLTSYICLGLLKLLLFVLRCDYCVYRYLPYLTCLLVANYFPFKRSKTLLVYVITWW